MEKELITIAIYKEDWMKLNNIMKKGEIYRDKFHELIKKEVNSNDKEDKKLNQ